VPRRPADARDLESLQKLQYPGKMQFMEGKIHPTHRLQYTEL